MLTHARSLKWAGQYDEALAELDKAAEMAKVANFDTPLAAIALHRVDIFIAQEKWDEAESLLGDLKAEAETHNEQAQLAYILVTWGTLAQAQGNWDAARDYYEQGLELARESGSLGAEGRAQSHLADTYLREGNASFAAISSRKLCQNSLRAEMSN
jgi:tetratricopeptide (TPR) repeat protein